MPHHLYFNDGDPDNPDPYSVAQICDELTSRIDTRRYSWKDATAFVDWQSAIKERDEFADSLGAAVVTLAKIVKDLAKDVDDMAP